MRRRWEQQELEHLDRLRREREQMVCFFNIFII